MSEPTPSPAPSPDPWYVISYGDALRFAMTVFVSAAVSFSTVGMRGCSPSPTPTPVEPPADISLPAEVTALPGMPADLTVDTKGKLVRWDLDDGAWMIRRGDDGKTVSVGAPVKGRYRLRAWTCVASGPTEAAKSWLVVGDAPPIPPGPGPGPPPQPVPIPGDGFRVMVIYDRTTLGKLPPLQLAALYASDVQAYLDAKCVKIGTTPEWRMFPSDAPTGNETKLWQDAFKRPRGSLPWVIISTGSTGYEGPLPPDKDKLLELLRKYAEKTAMFWTEGVRRAA